MSDRKDDTIKGKDKEAQDIEADIDRAVEELFVPVRTDFVIQENEQEAPAEEPDPHAEEAEPKNPFERLKEEMLTLEWEFSEEHIRSFAGVLKECHAEDPANPYVTAVAKMMTGVLKYLGRAGADAILEAPKFLKEATDVIIAVGTELADKAKAKKMVEELVGKFKRLKSQLQKQMRGMKPKREAPPPEPAPALEPEPVPEPVVVPRALEELDEINAQLTGLLRLVENLTKLEIAFEGKPVFIKLIDFVTDLKGRMKERVQTAQSLIDDIARKVTGAPE